MKENKKENLELYASTLRGLISYHKRMTAMSGCYKGNHEGKPELCKSAEANNGKCPAITVMDDYYLGALQESLRLIEQEIATL